jgi:hypothetical protein
MVRWLQLGEDMRVTRLGTLALLLVGCTSTQAGSDAVNPVIYPACHWPAALDPTDAGDSRCQAKRYRLSCDGGDAGVRAFCISDDATQCEGPGRVQGVTFTCHHDCAPNEFGLICGGIGPASAHDDPPAGCHSSSPTPGGIIFYCCPCS